MANRICDKCGNVVPESPLDLSVITRVTEGVKSDAGDWTWEFDGLERPRNIYHLSMKTRSAWWRHQDFFGADPQTVFTEAYDWCRKN
jgi:hypothetical protein